jgi:hypothetical protein
MQSNPIESESKPIVSQWMKKCKILILSIMIVVIIYVLFFGQTSVPESLIKTLLVVVVMYTFHLVKQLKSDKVPDRVEMLQNANRAPAINDLSRRTMQDLGFSEYTIAKSNQFMQRHFADIGAISIQKQEANFMEARQSANVQTSYGHHDSRAQYKDSRTHDVSKHEKSILDMINDAYSASPLARFRAQQTRTSQNGVRETVRKERTSVLNHRDSSINRIAENSMAIRRTTNSEIAMRKDSKLSISKAKYTVNKASVTSKSDLRRDLQNYDKIAESDIALEKQLIDMNVNIENFNHLACHGLPMWLANYFVPDLIRKNLTNIQEINDILHSQGKELKEHRLMSKMIEEEGLSNHGEHYSNFRLNRSDPNDKQLRMTTIDDLLRTSSDPALNQLLSQRMKLDILLAPAGFDASKIRNYVLQRLLVMQKDNFTTALEQNYNSAPKNFPFDFEILLNAFVCYAIEFDQYFAKYKPRNSIFIQGFLPQVYVPEDGIYLEVGGSQINCRLHKTILSFIKSQAGAFSLMAFFMFFINDKHRNSIKVNADSPFADLMRRFESQ